MRDVNHGSQNIWAAEDPLILTSKSLSRLALLTAAGLEVDVISPSIDERVIEDQYLAENGSVSSLALRLAEAKAVTASKLCSKAYCLGADQTLVIDDRVVHKPRNMVEAASTLASLSGKTHRVISACCLARRGVTLFAESDCAELHMRALTESDISFYLDLAGSAVLSSVGVYQVERLGIHLFERIEGDHCTILGLPMLKLLDWLRRRGLTVI